MKSAVAFALVLCVVACQRDGERSDGEKPAVAPAKQPSRVAVKDDDLRVMLAEVASAKA